MQVRSIDQEEDADEDEDWSAEGRVIEAFTEPVRNPLADSVQQAALREQPKAQPGAAAEPGEEEGGEGTPAADQRSMWQRLRGVKLSRGANRGAEGPNGQRSGQDGRLSAARILERSTSRNGGTGGPDAFGELLGLGSGHLSLLVDTMETPWSC